MDQVCIPVPMPEPNETLELEVTVGGTTHLMQYRIETVPWNPAAAADDRFERLQSFVQEYDSDWTLVQIGAPGQDIVPVTFRQHRSDASPRNTPSPSGNDSRGPAGED